MGQQQANLKGVMTPAHDNELRGYHRNIYEAIAGEMEGTLVPVSHDLWMPANSYGDRPVSLFELHQQDRRLFNDTTYFHENLDKTNTARHANPFPDPSLRSLCATFVLYSIR